MRKAVLARCGLRQSPQRPNIADDEGGQRRSMLDHARRRSTPAEQPDIPFCPSCKRHTLAGRLLTRRLSEPHSTLLRIQ